MHSDTVLLIPAFIWLPSIFLSYSIFCAALVTRAGLLLIVFSSLLTIGIIV
jgi:hypothetical protein